MLISFDDENDVNTSTGFNSVSGQGVNDLMSVWKSVNRRIYPLDAENREPMLEELDDEYFINGQVDKNPLYKDNNFTDVQLNTDILVGCIPDGSDIEDYRITVACRDLVLYGKADNIEKVSHHIRLNKYQPKNFFVRPSDHLPSHLFLFPGDTENNDYITCPIQLENGGIVIDISEISDPEITVDINGMLYLPHLWNLDVNIYDTSDIKERTVDFKYIKNGYDTGRILESLGIMLELNRRIKNKWGKYDTGSAGISIDKPKLWNVNLEIDKDLLSSMVEETVVNCHPPQRPGKMRATYINGKPLPSYINFNEGFFKDPGTYRRF